MNEENGCLAISELLGLGGPIIRRKPRGKRRFKEWHWRRDDNLKFYSNFWTYQEAIDNTPREPGTFRLERGHHGRFILIDTIING